MKTDSPVDNDLTMLGSPDDPGKEAVDKLAANPPKVDTTDWTVLTKKTPTTKLEVDKRMLEYGSGELTRSLGAEGAIDMDLDVGQGFGTTQETRARNQSEVVKGLKAIGGGIYTGGLIALEQVGYMADIQTYTNMFKETEDLSGNWWTNIMRDAQESAREGTFKIYENDPDENSVLAQIFKWSSLEGAVSSSVGFGLPGLGAARLVSYLGSYGKFQQMAKLTDMALGNITGKGMQGATKAFVGPLSASMMSNYFMGQMMAVDTYQQSMEVLQDKIAGGNISTLDAQKIAAKNAQEVVGLNMALTSTAFLRFGNIFKRTKGLSARLKNPTTMNHMKDMVVKGAPTAFVENVYQEMIQMEQIYDTKGEAGVATDYSEDYWDRVSQLALSNRAIHAGALGIVGGPIQFAIIQKPLMRGQFRKQREAFKYQDETINYFEELGKNNFKDFVAWEDAINKAAVSGDIKGANVASDLALYREVIKGLEWGNTDFMKKSMEDISKLTAEEAIAQGLDEKTYQQSAIDTISMIDEAQGLYMQHAGKENTEGIVYNRMSRNRVEMHAIDMIMDHRKLREKVQERLKMYPELKDIQVDENFKVIRDPARKDNLSEVQKKALVKQEAKEDTILSKVLTNNADVKESAKILKKLDKAEKLNIALEKQYEGMISPEGQRKWAVTQKKNIKNYDENATKESQKKQEDQRSEASRKTRDTKEVLEDSPKETPEETVERIDKWDKEIADGYSTIDSRKTFTWFNDDVAEVSTPGDIRRSEDGRYFQVTGQMGAQRAKGGLDKFNAPYVREVTAEGKPIKGKPGRFELPGNNVLALRPEVLQAKIGKGSAWYYTKSLWAPYEKADTNRKPNNRAFIAREEDRASAGLAITVKNSQFKDNKTTVYVPGDMIEQGYQLDLLNQPLVEGQGQEYEVVLKKNAANKSVDVYKVMSGAKDIKITRLNRHSNMNYGLILDALAKGEVRGKVIAHYSDSSNVAQKFDTDGKKIYSSVMDMHKLPNNQLPNGKVYIAQSPGTGKYSGKYDAVTMDEDGKTYTEGTLDVTLADGRVVPLTIPYNDMKTGDTYVLMVAPGGRLIPMTTHAAKLSESRSKSGKGETLVDDVIGSMWSAIHKALPKIMQDEQSYNTSVRDAQKNSAEVSSVNDQSDLIKTTKRAEIDSNFENLKNAFDEGPHKFFRPFFETKKKKYHENGTETIDTYTDQRTGKPKAYVNQRHFSIQAYVDKNNMITPAIKVPAGERSFNYILLSEKPDEFREVLGNRFRRMAIIDMMEGGKAVANDMIKSGDISIDFDPAKGFVGASATIELFGDDFRKQGSLLATTNREFVDKRFPGMFSEPTQDNIDDTVSELNLFTSLDATNEESLIRVARDGAADVVKAAEDFVANLALVDNISEQKKIKSFFKSETVPADYEVAYNEAINALKGTNMTEAVDEIARAHAYLSVLSKDIESKKVKLKVVTGKLGSDRPVKYTQPEGRKFIRGDNVYHTYYGFGKLTSVTRKDHVQHYMMQKKGSKVKVKVLPNSTFEPYGKYADLAKSKKKVGTLDGAELEAMQNKIVRLQNELYKKSEKKAIQDPTTSTYSNKSSYAVDNFISESIRGAEKPYTSIIHSLAITDRVEEYRKGINNLNNLHASLNERKNETPITQEDVELISKTMQDSIPYTDKQLEDLIDSAENNPEAVTEIQDFIKFKQALDNQSNFETTQMLYVRPRLAYGKVSAGKPIYLPALNWGDVHKEQKGTMKVVAMKSNLSTLTARISSLLALENEFNQFPVKDAPAKVKDAPTREAEGAAAPVIKKETKTPSTTVESSENDKSAILEDVTEESLKEVYGFDSASLNLLYESDVAVADKKKMLRKLAVASAAGMLSGSSAIKAMESIGIKAKPNSKQASVDRMKSNQIMRGQITSFEKWKEGDQITNTQEVFDAEVSSIKDMLPQVPIHVLENAVDMVNKFGVQAIGAYDKGVRYLVNNAEVGTAYHETFHAVSDLFLNPVQKKDIAKEHGYNKWNIALEEKLASEFEKYAHAKAVEKASFADRVIGATRRFFQGMLDWFKGTRSIDITEVLFDKIVAKGFADSKSEHYLSTMENHKLKLDDMDRYKAQLSDKNNVTLQGLLEAGKIKIVC